MSPTALIEAKRLLVNVPAEVERLESGWRARAALCWCASWPSA